MHGAIERVRAPIHDRVGDVEAVLEPAVLERGLEARAAAGRLKAVAQVHAAGLALPLDRPLYEQFAAQFLAAYPEVCRRLVDAIDGWSPEVAAKLMLESRRPVLYVGGGTIRSRASRELTMLAEKELKRSGEFQLPGMVKLVLQKRKARTGRNPATGEEISIPAKTVVKARIVKQMKDAVLPKKA